MGFFKKSKKNIIILETESDLLKTLLRFDEDFKKRFNDEVVDEGSQNCCVKLFSCLSSTKDKIPLEYQNIISWLSTLAAKQIADGEVNQVVIVSALHASVDFASQDVTGSGIPAKILKELIRQIAKQFELDIEVEADYRELIAYCQSHEIEIPESIMTIINQSPSAMVA